MKVTNFYKDKGVLITGTTGFVGKVILEKLLWIQPDVKKIYVLIRTQVLNKFQKNYFIITI